MNKLWSDRKDINQKIEKFTIGKDAELDIRIAAYDMLGSMAHAIMLYESDLMNREDLSQILTELNKLLDQVENGEFIIEEGVEDVHSQVEFILTRNIGEPGKKLHTSRSRNDQVLVDLKLYYRDFLQVIGKKIETIVGLFLKKSERHREVLMPGYTHMQVAMPSSFGLWFGAYGEALIHDFAVIKNTLEIINHNPLGSAAGYGTSFPIRRKPPATRFQIRKTARCWSDRMHLCASVLRRSGAGRTSLSSAIATGGSSRTRAAAISIARGNPRSSSSGGSASTSARVCGSRRAPTARREG